MTKTSKAKAITFPTTHTDPLFGTTRKNIETGVEIHSWEILPIHRTTRQTHVHRVATPIQRCLPDGSGFDLVEFPTLTQARAYAVKQAEAMRLRITAARAKAADMDVTQTARIAAQVAVDAKAAQDRAAQHPAGKVVRTLLSGAAHSARAGFIQTGRDRLARALRILDGTETAPTDAESVGALETALATFTMGTPVRLLDGTSAVIDGTPKIGAEDGRVFVGVKARVNGRWGYFLRYADDLTVITDAERLARITAETERQLATNR